MNKHVLIEWFFKTLEDSRGVLGGRGVLLNHHAKERFLILIF
jgi:hypothetical protein